MAAIYKKNRSYRDIPDEFTDEIVKFINRIEKKENVLGVMYFRNDVMQMYTVPEMMGIVLANRLPLYTAAVHRAVTEIIILWRYLLNYYITMKIITNLLKDSKDEWLVRATAVINTANPIVDRIMEDESVEGVIMTNCEGAPILTNVSLTAATNYGLALHRLGTLAQMYIKELNPFEEVLIIRVNTKKIELMLAPDPEFNIIVIQHARHKLKEKKEIK